MRRVVALPAAAGLGLLLIPAAAHAAPASPVCSGGTCTVSFSTSGAPESFVVLANVHSLTAAVAGGSGGLGHQGFDRAATEPGGAGGAVTATIPVTPGQTLTVVVGGRGSDALNTSSPSTTAPGGYGGGGTAVIVPGGSDGAGGGGSFVFLGSSVLVAAGGGGGGGYGPGGAGGAGGPAQAGTAGGGADGGGAATPNAPGAAGVGGGTAGTGPASGPSTFGVGGASSPTCPAGAGGGGMYGGGSGGCVSTGALVFGGGGGGSGTVAPSVSVVSRSTHTGNGTVQFSWQQPVPTTTTLTAAPTTTTEGGKLTLTAKVTAARGTAAGSVTFRTGSAVLGSAALHNGVATLTVSAQKTAGTESFTAAYQGAVPYLASTSASATVTVTAPAPPAPTPPAAPSASAATSTQQLANTGPKDAAQLTWLGSGSVALGCIALAFARRRAS